MCDKLTPQTCTTVVDNVTVTAVVNPVTENGTVPATGGTAIANVAANDVVNGLPATLGAAGNATVATSGVWPAGVTLDPATGAINVGVGTVPGVYPVAYELCDKLTPQTCTTVVVIITVSASVITATNDDYTNQPINSSKESVLDVLNNDTINKGIIASSQVIVRLVDTNGVAGVSVAADGKITIPAGTPVGTYVLTYSICDKINPNNCATATVTIVVKDPCDFDDSVSSCDILVHNAFSPNNDGTNEVFTIERIENYPENTVEIYNRWGVLVFEVNGYDNTNKVFVGISEGRVTVNKADALPNGTYYYVVKYKKPLSGVMKQKAGFLYLSR